MTITDTKTETARSTTTLSGGQLAPTQRLNQVVRRAEAGIVGVTSRYSVLLLRMAMGMVFIWFGALKVAGTTPVADLVAGTVPWLDRSWFVPALGAAEIVMGVALLVGRLMPFVCAVLTAHLCGTFLVLVMEPQLAFQDGNPLLLTTIGEFVVKNLVLISAALVLASKIGTSRAGRAHDHRVDVRR